MRTTVCVDVEVSFDNFSDADLIAEMKERDLSMCDDGDPHFAIRDALKIGDAAKALELTRAMICNMFGVIL